MYTILFLFGGMLVYYLVMPLAIKFFYLESMGSNTNLPIQLEAKVNEYLSLIMRLILLLNKFSIAGFIKSVS